MVTAPSNDPGGVPVGDLPLLGGERRKRLPDFPPPTVSLEDADVPRAVFCGRKQHDAIRPS
eukprot:4903604-Alexandrium_andersonii.AAC.1